MVPATSHLSIMNNSPDMKMAQELELVSSTLSTLDVARKTGDPEETQSPILVNAQGQARIVRKVSISVEALHQTRRGFSVFALY